jgi:hypothetical protein
LAFWLLAFCQFVVFSQQAFLQELCLQLEPLLQLVQQQVLLACTVLLQVALWAQGPGGWVI